MIDPTLLPKQVREDIQEFILENGGPSNATAEDDLRRATPFEAIDAYLKWNGIIGLTDEIISAVLSVFAASDRR